MRVLLLLFALAASVASAEAYTVQVAAFQGSTPASALATALQLEGFAAYLEAATSTDRRVERVRVGCFGDVASAEGVAALLRSAYGHQAAVMRLEREVSLPCVTRELGFLLPAGSRAWGVAAQGAQAVVFWTQVGAERGYVAFDEEGWRVVQPEAFERGHQTIQATSAAPSGAALARVRAHVLRGVEVVLLDDRVLAAGSLLWHSAQAIVMSDGRAVVALRLGGAR